MLQALSSLVSNVFFIFVVMLKGLTQAKKNCLKMKSRMFGKASVLIYFKLIGFVFSRIVN
jgi:hypothetical protein